ncbi:hypothetical protein F5888DRAFT_942894 [Russula emetica]|nr:hypothetical protein F5888DRAFT_942894 [Russula emetica]
MKYSDTAIYVHGVMDKLKSLTKRKDRFGFAIRTALPSKTVKGNRHLPNREIRQPGCKHPLYSSIIWRGRDGKQSNLHTVITYTSSWVSTRKVLYHGLLSVTDGGSLRLAGFCVPFLPQALAPNQNQGKIRWIIHPRDPLLTEGRCRLLNRITVEALQWPQQPFDAPKLSGLYRPSLILPLFKARMEVTTLCLEKLPVLSPEHLQKSTLHV